MKSNLASNMIDTIMELEKEDEENGTEEKEIPVKHFYIDVRMIYIKRKLRPISRDPTTELVLSNNEEGFSMYQLSKFLSKLNDLFGHDIEKQREIRNLIDSIFF